MKFISPGLVLLLAAVTQALIATPVNEAAIINSATEWLSHGRDYQEHRYSPLGTINRGNVDKLDLAWSFEFSTARGMEATPRVHNGVITVSTGWSHVHALDARNGSLLWHHDAYGRHRQIRPKPGVTLTHFTSGRVERNLPDLHGVA